MPPLVFGIVEVHRLQRELEALGEYMLQQGIRTQGKQAPMPKVSRILDALASENNMNLLMEADRNKLATFLQDVERKAPVIHMSFASDPSSAFTAKIVSWLRSNIHPYALVQVGLQPGITAGCIVRVHSRVFDCSLRNRFKEQRPVLFNAIVRSGAKP
jgi:F0F1-type ATP synthase delta subunit